MGDASTGTFLIVASAVILAAIRWLVLIASTILVLFVTWLILSLIWARSDSKTISIRPFVVVDPSGNLKNAETGFAQILSAQMAELQNRILQARTLLRQAATAQTLSPQVESSLQVPEGRTTPTIVEAPWPELNVGEAREKLDLKVEGVDVSGVISWIRAQLVHERKGLAFTAHIGGDGTVTIAGDVSDMGIKDVRTLYLAPAQHSPVDALNALALHLFQLRLVGDDPRLRDLPVREFGALIDRLCETVDPRLDAQPDADRKQRYRALSAYFAGLLDGHGDWLAMMILAAETARRGGDFEAEKKYLQLAFDNETRLPLADRDPARLRLITASLRAVTSTAAAQQRTNEVLAVQPGLIARSVLRPDDTAGIEALRNGFQALYDEKGGGGYAAVAGLNGLPGWYSWNHQQNSRSARQLRLFLPWHRAYLANFEKAARERVKDFALRCWDWTQGGIPDAFAAEKTPDGSPNPLRGYNINLPQSNPPITRFTTRDPSSADQLPKPSDVTEVLSRSNWADFSDALENLSDLVHGWTGGDMGVIATTAYDPLYYAHHCQVDRIWARWQLTHPGEIDQGLLDVVLDPFGVKVRDVLDVRKLGYEYPGAAIPQ